MSKISREQKVGINSFTEQFFDSSSPTNPTPQLSVYSALPLQFHSTSSQCYRNKRWREAAVLISSLTYSPKSRSNEKKKKCFSAVSCLKMDSAVRGSWPGHIVHPLRVNDHPHPGVQEREDRSGLDRDRLLSPPEMHG